MRGLRSYIALERAQPENIDGAHRRFPRNMRAMLRIWSTEAGVFLANGGAGQREKRLFQRLRPGLFLQLRATSPARRSCRDR